MWMLEEFPWDSDDRKTSGDSINRICFLADQKEIANRALALCAIMGAEIQNVQGQSVYRAFYRGAVFGRWLYPARAAVAFCIAMDLDIET